MRYFLLGTLFSTITFFTFSQDSFQGHFVYTINIVDTNLRDLYPETHMVVYTNDTIVRTENQTAHLGLQIHLRHLYQNKSYLLIDNNGDYYAIKHKDTAEIVVNYESKKRCKKQSIAGYKAKKAEISYPTKNKVWSSYFIPQISGKYIEAYTAVKGLPALYYLDTPDGWFKYELTEVKSYQPDRNLFGIPEFYKKVTFDEFIEAISKEEN